MENPEDEAWEQLSTRIPKALRHRLRQHCVRTEILVRDFVTMALREKLAGSSEGPAATKGKPYGRKAGRRLWGSVAARGLAAPR
jgi:hypothetical protein